MKLSEVIGGDGRSQRHLALARGYAEAAGRVLSPQIADETSLAYFAIVAHAMELALKSILIADGYDEEQLMMMGHNLRRCCRAIERRRPLSGGMISEVDAAVIEALDYPHAIQSLRYPGFAPEALPDPTAALDCLRRVLQAVPQITAQASPSRSHPKPG